MKEKCSAIGAWEMSKIILTTDYFIFNMIWAVVMLNLFKKYPKINLLFKISDI